MAYHFNYGIQLYAFQISAYICLSTFDSGQHVASKDKQGKQTVYWRRSGDIMFCNRFVSLFLSGNNISNAAHNS